MSEEVILKTKDVSVRIMPLGPKANKPWHFHRNVIDNIFCLSGTIVIRLKNPQEELVLKPGDRIEILPYRIHQVVNPEVQDSTYLLVQGVGEYDFNPFAPASEN